MTPDNVCAFSFCAQICVHHQLPVAQMLIVSC